MMAVESKRRPFPLQPLSPNIHHHHHHHHHHPATITSSSAHSQRKVGLASAGSSTTSTESASALSSTSSLRSRQYVSSEQPIQEQCLSPSYQPLYVSNTHPPSQLPLGSGSRHYLCQDSLPAHPFHARSSSRENSVSDSEHSTSSAASASALSESSELRALFSPMYERDTKTHDSRERYNQLKIKPGSEVSERTRQILYRPQQFESDSSSSLAESSDSLNTQDHKHREREHYNKLKLNLDNLSGNKRALIGLKVLYRDPPRGYRQMPGPQPPIRSLSQHRRSRGIFQQKSADEVKPRTRYWSEGHSNKIHSVAADPVRSKSLSWKQEEEEAAALVLKMKKSPRHLSASMRGGRSPSRHPPVYRTRSLSDTQSFDVMMKDEELERVRRKSSKSTDNLSRVFATPRPAHRSASVGDQSMHHDTFFFKQRSRVFTDPGGVGRGQRANPSNLLTSTEARNTNAEVTNTFDQDRTSGSINFIVSPITLKYEGEEVEYHSREHDFTVKIPKAALKKRSMIEVQVGLAIHGPFTFPERSQNVSPILWLCSIPDTKFRKPIQITLPHCMTDARPTSLKRKKTGLTLQFMMASLKSDASSKSRNRQFEFNPTEGEETFAPNEMSGTLLTKHLSPLCIVAINGGSKTSQLGREVALHACYCVVPVLPRATRGREWSIHFCVTFNLQSCIQSLKNYFSESDFQLMPPNPFQFAPPLSTVTSGDGWESEGVGMGGGEGVMGEPELEIRFPRELPESGWHLVLESDKKIPSSAISFSPCRRSDLFHSLTSSFTSSFSSSTTHTAHPPPMFTITADGERAERAAVTCVSFVGSTEPVTVKVTLPMNGSERSRNSASPSPASPDTDYDHLRYGSDSPPADY